MKKALVSILAFMFMLLIFFPTGYSAPNEPIKKTALEQNVQKLQVDLSKAKSDVITKKYSGAEKINSLFNENGTFYSGKSFQPPKESIKSKEKEDLLKEKMMYIKKSGKYSSLEKNQQIDMNKIYNRQIIVKLYEGKEFDDKKYKCEKLDIPGFMEMRKYVVLRVPEIQDYETILNEIKKDPAVEYVQPDYIYKISSIPNDPLYSYQWYLNKIKMPEAWDGFKEINETVVAVIDSGVDYTHPDLKDKVLPGVDFVNNDNDPMDDAGHGTHVAGIIAAVSNNSRGIAGITNKVKILPVKAGDKNGITSFNAVKGIYYAIDNHVDVINMSFGNYTPDPIEEDAILQAYESGIVVVASAGNESTDEWSYPASYWPVISVGASDEEDNKTNFSDWGSFLDILAPGTNILSTIWPGADDDGVKDGYTVYAGTSMAAPIVSAVAALLKSEHPSWGPDEIEWALELGADRKNNNILWDQYDGYGRVNAFNSLMASLPDLSYDAGDNKDSARKLSPNEPVQEKIDKPQDNDFFSFEVKQKSNVHIKISNVPQNLDLVGFLRKYSGDYLVDDVLIDDGVKGQDEELNTTLDSGTYYLWVYDYFNHWDNKDYDVEVDISPAEPGSSDIPAPQASIDSGTYSQPITVSLTCPDPEAIIKYTLDGTTPSKDHGAIYSQEIVIDKTTTLKAVAVKGDVESNVVTYNYEIKTMSLSYTNEITFDIKLGEDVGIKSVDLMDGTQVLASTQNISGNKATMVYEGDLTKPTYRVKVWSVDGRYGIKDVEIKSSMEVVETDAAKGLVRIRALMAGNLYKNGQFIKTMNQNDEYLFDNIVSGDTIKLVPSTGELTPAAQF